MKRLLSIFSAAIVITTVLPVTGAETHVSVNFFHDQLDAFGDWREVGDYGYCWQPRGVDDDWRPYSDGRWLYTDAGWTWDSEEPYSWAVYHYGRWARVDRVGWVWVPGTEWGPAWVSWRRSEEHVGWAPLPPEARFTRSVGFGARVDADFDIGPTNYSFVSVRNFGAPSLRTVIVAPRENITIIHQSTNITRISYVNNVVYNQGPQYEAISRESAQPIRRLKLERREDFDGGPHNERGGKLRPRVDGDSLRVVAPRFDAAPATAPRKVAAKVDKPEVDRGWKNAGQPADVAKLRAQIRSEPATTAELPPRPKAGKPDTSPALSEFLPSKPGKNMEREKGSESLVPPSAAASTTTGTTVSPLEKPVPADRHAKPGKSPKNAKSVKPDAGSLRPPQPTTEPIKPSNPPKEFNKQGRDTSLRPPEIQPRESAPAQTPKSERAATTRKAPAAASEPTRPKMKPQNRDAAPNVKPPATRPVERSAPKIPEPHPQAKRPEQRKPAAPAVAQPKPSQPAKGKAKGKDEKNDPAKPEGAPQ